MKIFKIGKKIHAVDPPCSVIDLYFRGILHCLERGKTPGTLIIIFPKKNVQIEKRISISKVLWGLFKKKMKRSPKRRSGEKVLGESEPM